MRRVAVGTDQRVGISDAVLSMNHRRHAFQINLMHDAVTRRDHVHVFKRLFGPVNKVEAVFVTTIFNRTVFFKCLRIKATAFNSQRVIHDQLHRHDRIHFRRITTLLCNRITQTSEIDQRSLSENIVADHAGRKPGKVQIALAFNQLT